jgi:hypothetical protein
MTVRDLVRSRAWLAALAGGAVIAAAAAQTPVVPPPPEAPVIPPQPGAASVIPPSPGAVPVMPPAPGPLPLVTPPQSAPAPDGKPAGAELPPLVLPVSADEPAKREVAPAPRPVAAAPVAVPVLVEPPMAPVVVLTPPAPPAMVIKEVAKPIPPEPVKPVEQAKPADPPKVTGPSTTDRPVRVLDAAPLGADTGIRSAGKTVDHVAAFEAALLDARTALARARDYSCHFVKQERVHGKLLSEQTAELHARANPYSVAVKVIAPASSAGAEAAYVAGKNAGKVRMKPAGAYGIQAWVSLDPADPRIASESRHSVAEVGIAAVIDRLEKIVAIEHRLRNPLGVLSSDYTFAGRPVTRYEVVAGRPHALRYAHTVVVYVDKETRLPVRFEAYDQPAGVRPAGELLECYSFVNVKLNSGVGAEVFEK